jgi:thiamine-monophosphate kinase
VSDRSSLGLGPGIEFDLIRRIADRLGPRARGLGDDCALLQVGQTTLAVSTDLSVEGVHFRREWLTPTEIGWRAAASALSDLAAEGATPIGLMASVGVPPDAGEGNLESIMEGVGDAAVAAGASVSGGDLSAAPVWTIDVTVFGTAERPVRRDGALAGDSVWVTGELGGARAALKRWLSGEAPAKAARQAFAHPMPRITAGLRLARAGARAMIDLSDGLAGDAGHLAAASGKAVVIDLERLPIHPDVEAMARELGTSSEQFAALGGEDYELLAVMPPGFTEREAHDFTAATGVALRRIGTVETGSGARFRDDDTLVRLAGYDHFA